MNDCPTGKMIIVAAPSGAGKSTFVSKILQEREDLCETVTYTTRQIRSSEQEGVSYHFVSNEKFQELTKSDFFVEWAHVHNCCYGTPKHQIDDIWAADQAVIMDVDIQGAETFKKKFPNALSVFIMPPSIDELRQRVLRRDGSSMKEEELELRMSNAKKEMGQADSFDVQVVNDEFMTSYESFKKVIEEYLDKN